MRLPAKIAKLLRPRGLFMVHGPGMRKLSHDWIHSCEFVQDLSATSSTLVPVESLSRAENIPGSNRDIKHLGPRWGPFGHDNAMQPTSTFCILACESGGDICSSQ